MKRREFIKKGAGASLGILVLPMMGISTCNEEEENPVTKPKIIIIGAGVAGLYAAHILQSKGIDFQLLEASGSYGGRLAKLEGFADYPLDLGAQWLHGKKSIIGKMVEKTGTKITFDDSEEIYWFRNSFAEDLPNDIESLLDEKNLPDVSFLEYAHQQGYGAEYDMIVEAAAGDFGADASNISAYWYAKEEEEWSSGDDDYKFESTFFDLFEKHIVPGIKDKIQLNTIVKKIDSTGEKIKVTDSNGKIYEAGKVIITVPVTILKSGEIDFIPPLPPEKTKAFSKIGMDAGMKVFMKFNTKFYHQNIIGGKICASYADESVGKNGKDHVLLAFIMGGQAEYLTSLGSDEKIIAALLNELDEMYDGKAGKSFIKAHVQNWTTHPFIRGAYSYSTVGIGDARKIAALPVNNKLFFAGEALNLNGHHQSVHGAAETGYEAALAAL